MKELYSEKDYETAFDTRKKLLIIYFCIFGVLFGITATFFTLIMLLPYPTEDSVKNTKDLYTFFIYFTVVIGVVFSYIYLGICVKRANAYCRLLQDMKVGQKTINESTFLQNDNTVSTHKNVDYRTMIVLEWSDKTQEYMRRNVLVDKEKEMPELKNGDIIKYVTHSNVLMAYGLKDEEQVFNEIDE